MTKSIVDAVNEFKGDASIFNYENCDDSDEPVILLCLDSCDCVTGLVSVGDIVVGTSGFSESHFTQVCNESEFNKCVEEMTNMNINPVYTQAMVDAGVMPLVGMEFISTEFDEPRHSIVKAITNEYIIYICADPKHLSECCIEICANHHHPVTPHIELIDGKAYQFDYGNTSGLIGVYAKENTEFRTVAGYYPSKASHNIQLLEVK